MNKADMWNQYVTATEDNTVTGLPTVIKLRRVELSMSRRELAHASNISYDRLSKMENGEAEITMIYVSALAVALGWSMADMLAVACVQRGLVFGREHIARMLAS